MLRERCSLGAGGEFAVPGAAELAAAAAVAADAEDEDAGADAATAADLVAVGSDDTVDIAVVDLASAQCSDAIASWAVDMLVAAVVAVA